MSRHQDVTPFTPSRVSPPLAAPLLQASALRPSRVSAPVWVLPLRGLALESLCPGPLQQGLETLVTDPSVPRMDRVGPKTFDVRAADLHSTRLQALLAPSEHVAEDVDEPEKVT